jgi:hypothetical protein
MPGAAAVPFFELAALRFHFSALDKVVFPPGKAGNVLRGALGTALRRISCTPDCTGARVCPHRDECAYARIFEPSAFGHGPSGLGDRPRPFVLRAAHLNGARFQPGQSFHFDVHLFERNSSVAADFVRAFVELALEGIGPGRGRMEPRGIAFLDQDRKESPSPAGMPAPRGADLQVCNAGIPAGTDLSLGPEVLPFIHVDLSPDPGASSAVRVRFVTPTELKSSDGLAALPEFPVLFARIRDRVCTLRALYGGGPLEIDFRGIAHRSAAVRMTDCKLESRHVDRRSSKTGLTHPLGGFTGYADYAGKLTEFLPWLKAAVWTGVGRQTVWGKGQIEVSEIEPRGGSLEDEAGEGFSCTTSSLSEVGPRA